MRFHELVGEIGFGDVSTARVEHVNDLRNDMAVSILLLRFLWRARRVGGARYTYELPALEERIAHKLARADRDSFAHGCKKAIAY